MGNVGIKHGNVGITDIKRRHIFANTDPKNCQNKTIPCDLRGENVCSAYTSNSYRTVSFITHECLPPVNYKILYWEYRAKMAGIDIRNTIKYWPSTIYSTLLICWSACTLPVKVDWKSFISCSAVSSETSSCSDNALLPIPYIIP